MIRQLYHAIETGTITGTTFCFEGNDQQIEQRK